MSTLDKLDRQILRHLQADAAQPIQQVADAVGLSVNPCWRRIRRMEAEGVIEGRVALVDPEKVGLGLTVYVRVKTREHSAAWAVRLNEVIAAEKAGRNAEDFAKTWKAPANWPAPANEQAAANNMKRLVANAQNIMAETK